MSSFLLYVLGVFVLLVALQVGVWVYFFGNSRWWAHTPGYVRVGLPVMLVVFLNAVPAYYIYAPTLVGETFWHRNLVAYPYAVFVLATVVTGIFLTFRIAVREMGRLLNMRARFESPRREFLSSSGRWVFALGAATFSYAGYGESRQVRISRNRVEYQDLPEELDGITIVQITDLHAGPFLSSSQIDDVVSTINALRPDLIVITGDLINHNPRYIPGCVGSLDRLRADVGIYAVLGNHDYYTDHIAIRRALKKSRIRLLVDAVADPNRLPGSLRLMGVDDPVSNWTQDASFPDLELLVRRCPPGGFRLLLSHRPGAFRQARHLDVHMTLSGHTHGGQVILPVPGTRGLSLARMGLTYSHGWYNDAEDPEKRLYVNRGLGTIVAPVRINCPPEIAWIQLVRTREQKRPRSGNGQSRPTGPRAGEESPSPVPTGVGS